MSGVVLVLNVGSSSLKFACYELEMLACRYSGMAVWPGDAGQVEFQLHFPHRETFSSIVASGDHRNMVEILLPWLKRSGMPEPETVVHRIVHGGTDFRTTTLLDERASRDLQALNPLAPLHNPPALNVVEALRTSNPSLRQLGCFDTAFFADLPEHAYLYPLPYDWYTKHGIRRFGFHGLSHAYCTFRTHELLQPLEHDRYRSIVCHLGNGVSASAMVGIKPIATTMGFTPLDGMAMGTRPGALDPGILLYLQDRHGFSVAQLDNALNRQSGLLGLSGVSSDLRAVRQAARVGHPRAQVALRIFTDRIRAAIGSLAVTLGGVDSLVFTGGIGTHDATTRREICNGLSCLGIELDPAANERVPTDVLDRDISAEQSHCRIMVLQTREEEWMAREAKIWLKSSTPA